MLKLAYQIFIFQIVDLYSINPFLSHIFIYETIILLS